MKQKFPNILQGMKTFWIIALLPLCALAQDPAPKTPWQMWTTDPNTGLVIPCSGCTINTYAAGTNTPQAVYTDSSLGTANTNPVQTNSAGYVVNGNSPSTITGIWIGSACYKFLAKDSGGNTLWTQDHICDSSSVLKALLATSAGSGLVGFSQSATYSAATIGKKGQQVIDVQDAPYGAVADCSTDNGTAIAAAVSALTARGGGTLQFSGQTGCYAITAAISIPSNVNVKCSNAAIKNTAAHGSVLIFNNAAQSSVFGCTLIAANGSPVQPVSTGDGTPITIEGGSSYITIENNQLQGAEQAGVLLNNVTNYTIRDNSFTNCAVTTGLTSGNETLDIFGYGTANHGLIEHNTGVCANDFFLQFGAFATTTSVTNDNIVQFNQIANKNIYGIALYGQGTAVGEVVQRNRVLYNDISNITSRVNGVSGNEYGMCVYLVLTDDNDVIGNTCTNALIGRTGVTLPQGAISVSASTNIRITGNRIIGSNFDGIWVSNPTATANAASPVLVSGNKIEGATSIGLVVKNTGYVQSDHNTIDSAGGGGVSVDANSPYFSSTNDIVSNSGSAGAWGFVVSGNYATLSAPIAWANYFDGILMAGQNATVTNPITFDNSQASAGTYAGVHFAGTSGVSLNGGNSFDDQGSATQKVGFEVDAGYANTISTCTNADPIVCTATVAPPTGMVYLGGFTGLWAYLNHPWNVTNLSATTFSIAQDSSGFSTCCGAPKWSDGTVTLSGNTGTGNTASTFSILLPSMTWSGSQNNQIPDQLLNGAVNNASTQGNLPVITSGSGVPSGACFGAFTLYLRLDTPYGVYYCYEPNTWQSAWH